MKDWKIFPCSMSLYITSLWTMGKAQVLQTKPFLGLLQLRKAPSFQFQWVLMSRVWYTKYHWGILCRSLQWPEWGAEFRTTIKSWMQTLTWNMILFADIQPRNTSFTEPQIKSSLLSFACSYSQCCTERFGCMCGTSNCVTGACNPNLTCTTLIWFHIA